ncbi:hypothetical protein G4B88_022135 [Cannabis sativa]|nr:hypothetical protein G4B88_022135 [Cannabis sativa]
MGKHERYLYQRSRAVWMKSGDKNSKKFHHKASSRKKKNKITEILSSHGVWKKKQSDISEENISSRVFDLFVMVSRQLWYSRNLSMHNNFSPKYGDVIEVAINILDEYQSHNGKTDLKNIQQAADGQLWIPPEARKLVINVDASIDNSNHSSSVGGIVRDHHGRCYNSLPPLVAELKEIKEAISIAKDANINDFYIQSDCQNAISTVKNMATLGRDMEFLVDNIKKGLALSRCLGVIYVPRLCNRMAHCIVKNALLVKDFTIWEGGFTSVVYHAFMADLAFP